MESVLVWSSDKELMDKQIAKLNATVFVVVEDCCHHFSGVFANEQDAKKRVEELGFGYSYFESEI
jgi:hypothetical protein